MPEFTPTSEQESLIALDDGAFLVIAPPGSGKTTVLTERVARLVSSSSETFRVLALTFTNKAAENMRNRLFDTIGEHSARVTASTIHSFCLEALRNYGDTVGVPENASIYENENDRVAALLRGLVDDGFIQNPASADEKELTSILKSISALKRSLIPPEEAPQTVEAGIAPLGLAYAAYDRSLRLFGALDFDDILFFAYRLFSTAERVASQYRRVYRYVVVDEAQDTNVAQYEVLHALCGAALKNVMLVADADQSIFRFAGATTKNLLHFERDFRARRLSLTQNFRCAGSIVKAANTLIANNPGRITTGQEMTSAVLAAGVVEAASYATEAAEATAALAIIDHLTAHGLDPSWCYEGETTGLVPEDICILGRSRFALSAVLAALEGQGRAFKFSAGREDPFDSEAFLGFEAALRLVHNPADVLAQRKLARQGRPGPEPAILRDLVARLPASRIEFFRPLVALQDGSESLEATISKVLQATRAATFNDDNERAMVLADALMLERRWIALSALHGSDATVGRLLGDMALVGRNGIDGPGVRVLTIHAAKGLEYRAVILVGMNEGTFPDYRSRTADDVADERRNAYVAITRSERALFLLRARSRVMPWGDEKPQRVSRFIAEAEVTITDEP